MSKIHINEEKLRNAITEAFKEYYQECEALITERWSYSDSMDNALSAVYETISENIYSSETKYHKIDSGIGLYIGEGKLDIFGIKDISLHFYVYKCSDDNICREVIGQATSVNDYDEVNKVLTVTIYTVLGTLIEEPSNKNVVHELEHILQISNGRQYNPNYKGLMNKAYEEASRIISERGNNNSDFDVILSWLIYYSNPHEQDAFINEYYQDLRSMRQLIKDKNSEMHKHYQDYYQKIQLFKNNVDNPELQQALNRYRICGYTLNTFVKMVDSGYKRLTKKMKNVEKHFSDVVENASKSKFHLNTINNGSLIII